MEGTSRLAAVLAEVGPRLLRIHEGYEWRYVLGGSGARIHVRAAPRRRTPGA